MKNLKRLVLVFFLALKLSSCSFPDPVEPNYLGLVAQFLPEIQQNTAYYRGMDIGRFQLIWMQQLGGVGGADLEVDKYAMTSDMVQKTWYDYFIEIHPKIITAITYAHEAGAPAYRGMARLLLALNLQIVADSWGDIPYLYAIGYAQGISVIPYNTQEEIYEYIDEMVGLSLADFQTAISDQSPRPQANDLFYGGNLQKWVRAANLFRLRIALRLGHKNNDYGQAAIIIQNNDLLEGNADDMRYTYAGEFQNPFFFNDNIVRNSRVGAHFVDMLKETDDPRLPVFVKALAGPELYVGTNPGEANTAACFIGTGVASQNSASYVLTFVEQKFIEAEIMLRTGQQVLADQAFAQAVKASLMKFGVSNPAWESQYAEISNVTLQDIIEAKYVALYLDPEVWTDYRRTGFPQLTPYQGTQIPRRFIYPSQELAFNAGNVPAGISIFSRVWWDSL